MNMEEMRKEAAAAIQQAEAALARARAAIEEAADDSLAEIRDLAGELQRMAYDVEDWSRTKIVAPEYLLIRKRRAEADDAVREALIGVVE